MLAAKRPYDQAEGVRRIAHPRPVRVIAVASGKGGVGKTNVSVNLAQSMVYAGKSVLLMDADFGLANVDIMLGLQPTYNLSHVISGECTLEETIVHTAGGLGVIPASSGVRRMADMTATEHAGLIRAFSEISHRLDVLLVDTAAGISDAVLNFSRAAQEVIVVVCDEPASITDAYALIKVLNKECGVYRFRVLANMARTPQEGREVYQKLVKVTDRFLDAAIDYLGAIPYDDYLRKAVQRQKAVVDAYPRSKASTAFKNLASKADNWPIAVTAGGHLQFFVERLIHSSQTEMVLPA